MSGKKDDENKVRTGINKEKPSKTVGEQAQYETAEEMAIGRSLIHSPISSGAFDSSHRKRTLSTSGIVPLLEGNVSTAQRTHGSSTSGKVPLLEGNVSTAQRTHGSSTSGKVPLLEGNVSTAQRTHGSSTSGKVRLLEGNVWTAQRRHTSSTSGLVPLFQGNFSTSQSGVRDPVERQTSQSASIQRHAPLNESAVQVLKRQTPILERRDQVAPEGQTTLWSRFDRLSYGESSQEGHLPQAGEGVQIRVLQEGSDVQKQIERQMLQAESGIQDQIEEQSSLPESLVDYLLLADPQESSNLQRRVLERGPEGPIEGKESQVKNIIQFVLGAPIEASSSQGEVKDSVQEPMEGQASQEGSLVEYLYTGPPIEIPPPSLPTRPKEDLPEISVENILKGTRGRRDQSLFPSSSRQQPYMSLTQKMMLDESKEIVDVTEERKMKKNRFRVKFDDDTDEESASEEPQPPKSDSPSTDFLFPMDL